MAKYGLVQTIGTNRNVLEVIESDTMPALSAKGRWMVVVGIPPKFDPETQVLSQPTFTVVNGKINQTWKVQNKATVKLPTTKNSAKASVAAIPAQAVTQAPTPAKVLKPVVTPAPTPEPTEAPAPVVTLASTPAPTEVPKPVLTVLQELAIPVPLELEVLLQKSEVVTEVPELVVTPAPVPVVTPAPTPKPTEAPAPVVTVAPEPVVEDPLIVAKSLKQVELSKFRDDLVKPLVWNIGPTKIKVYVTKDTLARISSLLASSANDMLLWNGIRVHRTNLYALMSQVSSYVQIKDSYFSEVSSQIDSITDSSELTKLDVTVGWP